MNTHDIEQRLIEIAKQNPTGDYYVGGVGEDLRDLLRSIMGDRYPSDTLDEKSYECPPRPDPDKDPLGAMAWDDMERLEGMMIEKMSKSSTFWSKLLKAEPWPEGMGFTIEPLNK